MGCDIHLIVQVDSEFFENGEFIDKFVTIAQVEIDRDYPLFAAMANVRNKPGYTVYFPPRGFPDGNAYGYPWQIDGEVYHDPSWLTPDEFEKAIEGAATKNHSAVALLAYLHAFEGLGRKVRIVFCFDN